MLLRMIAAVAIAVSIPMAAQNAHPVPKDRNSLSAGEWFPYVFSKVAPLEEWNAILSSEDFVRDRYNSDLMYELAKRDTYVLPRFCFQFFRIEPTAYKSLYSAIRDYNGPVVWSAYGNCVGAFSQKPTGYINRWSTIETLGRAIPNPAEPDPDFFRKAIEDIPHFCQYLESTLGLTDKTPIDFDEKWLSWEGLQNSRPIFDNFVEYADHMPTLVRSVGEGSGRESADSHRLFFGVSDSEMGALLVELGANYDRNPVAPNYPLLSRLSDIASGALYGSVEINGLFAEITRAQTVAKQPSSVRALDKLNRIAKCAEKYGTAISFDGQ